MSPDCERASDAAYDIALDVNLPFNANSSLVIHRIT